MTSVAAKRDHPNREYAIGLARAFGGALIFGLPLLMTMEMWYFGFYLDRIRLLIFLGLNLFMLVGLSRFAGFEPTAGTPDDIMDALAAFAIGIIASAIILLLFNVLTPDMPPGEIVGKIAVQSVPASFGAMIARKQLSGGGDDDDDDAASEEEEELQRASYAGELFLMTAGALFLAFNVAPTEEIILIAFKMSAWHALVLMLLSLLILHAFVYSIGFAGQEQRIEGTGFAMHFVGYSVAGYGVALLVSLYVLWTFGRTDGADLHQIANMTVVLGFPAAVGAAIARLVV